MPPLWRRLKKLSAKLGQAGDVEVGAFVRTRWGVKGWLIHISGTPQFGTVQVDPERREIIELKYLFRATPDHAVAWLDTKEGE